MPYVKPLPRKNDLVAVEWAVDGSTKWVMLLYFHLMLFDAALSHAALSHANVFSAALPHIALFIAFSQSTVK